MRHCVVVLGVVLATALACGEASPSRVSMDDGSPVTSETPQPTPTKPAFIAHPPGVPTGPEECTMTADKPQYVTGSSLRSWKEGDAEERKLLEVKAKYADELWGIPGVFGIGVGLVTRGGQLTEDRAIIVSVDIDRPPDQEDVIERIPKVLDGCPVQVVEEERGREVGAVDTPHRSGDGGLQGGLEIGRPIGPFFTHTELTADQMLRLYELGRRALGL